jgi:hypothetical protein
VQTVPARSDRDCSPKKPAAENLPPKAPQVRLEYSHVEYDCVRPPASSCERLRVPGVRRTATDHICDQTHKIKLELPEEKPFSPHVGHRTTTAAVSDHAAFTEAVRDSARSIKHCALTAADEPHFTSSHVATNAQAHGRGARLTAMLRALFRIWRPHATHCTSSWPESAPEPERTISTHNTHDATEKAISRPAARQMMRHLRVSQWQ